MVTVIIWTMIVMFVMGCFGVYRFRKLEQRVHASLKELDATTAKFKRLVDGIQNMDRDEVDR